MRDLNSSILETPFSSLRQGEPQPELAVLICQELGYSEPFIQKHRWWAYPPESDEPVLVSHRLWFELLKQRSRNTLVQRLREIRQLSPSDRVKRRRGLFTPVVHGRAFAAGVLMEIPRIPHYQVQLFCLGLFCVFGALLYALQSLGVDEATITASWDYLICAIPAFLSIHLLIWEFKLYFQRRNFVMLVVCVALLIAYNVLPLIYLWI